jgi:hypothetical protein
MSQLTLVITFINKNNNIAFFEEIAKSGIHICLYTDILHYDILSKIIKNYYNIKMMKLYNLEDTFVYKTCKQLDYSLPDNRNNEKDTEEYIIMRHSILEVVNNAIEKNYWNSTHFAWIDISEDFMFKNMDTMSEFLYMLSSRKFLSKTFILPGNWNKLEKSKIDTTILNSTYWRFCGSLFLGDKQSISQFYSIYKSLFGTFIKRYKKLVWDFNYWAWLETTADWIPDFYYADHNDSIFKIPTKHYALLLNDNLEKTMYKYPLVKDFFPSNTSYLFHSGKHILNTRFVNYSYGQDGGYLINHSKHTIITKNIVSILNDDLIPTSYDEMDETSIGLEHNESYSVGLEDIRLYSCNHVVKFIATNVNYIGNRSNRMIIGEYDINRHCYINSQIIQPPTKTLCEKNWVPIIKNGGEFFIYKWSPFQIGKINPETCQLEIIESYEIKSSDFDRIRGSSIFINYGLKYRIGVVHFCEETYPRQYYHMLVILDDQSLKPVSYSDPFCFQHYGVEFCIGFTMIEDKYIFWVSKKDNDTVMVSIDLCEIPIHHIVNYA